MCICLQHIGTNAIQIRNYQIANEYIANNNKLGTAIYVHNKLTFDKIHLPNTPCQISAIKLYMPNNKKITICNLYNQPNQNYDLSQLPRVIENLTKPTLVLGDFNAHHPLWDENCIDTNDHGKKIGDFILNSNFCCLNEDEVATYFSKTHGTFSSIDLSICSADIIDQLKWNTINDLYTSDHYPIIITHLNQNSSNQEARYNLEKADWNKFQLYTRDIGPFEPMRDSELINENFIDFVINAANKSIPKCSPNTNKRQVPWWNNSLSSLIKLKHSLSRKIDNLKSKFKNVVKNQLNNDGKLNKLVALSIKISHLKPTYNKTVAIFRKEVIQERKTSWTNYVSSISSNTPIKQIWHKFKKINGTYIRPPRHPILQNGHRIHDPKEISNIIGRQFESVSSEDNLDVHFRNIKNKAEKKIINFETNDDIIYNKLFVMDELEEALNLSNNSAPGKDNVPFEMLKHLDILAKSYLLKFYNHIWLNGLFPQAWRHAIIIPIEKPGKDPSDPVNYRPISLTSCLCKLIEKMVNNRFTWYLEKNDILTNTQSGSRTGRSTLDPLTNIEDHIRRGFEKKKVTVAIFFDIKKAYDSTWRYWILKSLELNGFKGLLPKFIKNFLSQRTFQTRIDTDYSNNFQLQEGVPQGSVLSGTLFILAINDITKQLPLGVQNSLYVDDFAIYYSSNQIRHIQRTLNIANNRIMKWASSVGFKFATEKTKAIIFYKDKRWIKNQQLELKMGNTTINLYEKVKFLGMILDQHLNWKAHITYTKAKGTQALNLLKKLSHTTWGAKRDTMLMLYKATVLSILDYGCPIYASASENILNKLNPVHNSGLRLCTGAFKSSPVESLTTESGEMPLKYRRDIIMMKRALKMINGKSSAKETFNKNDSFLTSGNVPSFPMKANRLLEQHNLININLIPVKEHPPPWIIKKPHICKQLCYLKKNMNNPEYLRQHTLEHIRRKGPHNEIYTDGSKSDDKVGSAAIYQNEKVLISLPKNASVFTAELIAIQAAIRMISTKNERKFVIYSDSKSSIEAIQKYASKHELIIQIQTALQELTENRKEIEICWIPAHVGVQGNEEADKAAKEASSLVINNDNLPINDWLITIKPRIMQKWQEAWISDQNINKLKEIKETVYPWSSSLQKFRHQETILTRLRIGHSRLTHGHLMSTPHGNRPICSTCNTQITIKHILTECPKYRIQRQTYLRNRSLKEILSENEKFSAFSIFNFLKKCNLISEL